MNKKLQISMVHDIVCSWCPIGYKNIKDAINNLNIEVDFHFLPYELNPDMGAKGETIAGYFASRFDWNETKLLDYQKSLVKTADNVGVCIDFSKRKRYYNTRKAHLLMVWAERFNKQETLNKLFIEAYFKEGLDINNTGVLLDIAGKADLDKIKTETALASLELNQELVKKVNSYRAFNISSIPTFIVNETFLISGSNSMVSFEETLSKIIDKISTENWGIGGEQVSRLRRR